MSLATLSECWRYPIKSLLGERRSQLTINARGVEKDRLYALQTEVGKLGSGKNTRRFQKMPDLFALHGSLREDNTPCVTFPDTSQIQGLIPAMHEALSKHVGLPVSLAAESTISHFDAAPIHLLTTSSLRWLQEHVGQAAAVDPRRFRPNLVVDSVEDGPVEQTWIGRTIQIGDEVELLITAATERCVMIGFSQAELAQAPQLLRRLGELCEVVFGVYAQVQRGGRVKEGDAVCLKTHP